MRLYSKPEKPRETDPAGLRKILMDYLARREHTESELKAKLAVKGYDPVLIAEGVARLRAQGLQSDERFASVFVSSLVGRGKGPVFIRSALEKRGVERELAGSVIAAQETDWVAAARAARIKRFGETLPETHIEIARQTRFLLQRGFTAHQSRVALGDKDLE